MDPLSITASCAGLISAIGTVSFKIHDFVRTCREARRDLDRVSRELQSLESVLGLIKEDAEGAKEAKNAFPPAIGQHISGIVTNCNTVVVEIETCIAEYGNGKIKAKAAWAVAGQGDMDRLRTSLEAHKSALDLAVDVLALATMKEIQADTAELRDDTTAIKCDTAQILEEIAQLQSKLPHRDREHNDFMLQKFLEEMTEYTEAVLSQEAPVENAKEDDSRTPLEREDSEDPQEKKIAPVLAEEKKPAVTSSERQQKLEPQLVEEHEPLATLTQHAPKASTVQASRPPVHPQSPPPPQQPGPPAEPTGADQGTSQNRFHIRGFAFLQHRVWAETLACNKLTWDHDGLHAKSFNGYLAVDCPLPNTILGLHPSLEKSSDLMYEDGYTQDEVSYWRLTVVPKYDRIDRLSRRRVTLRPSCFSPARKIKTLVTFELAPGEQSDTFLQRWDVIYGAIYALPYRLDWKKIVVHINGPLNWEGLDKEVEEALERLSAKQKVPANILSLDGKRLSVPYLGNSARFNGKQVNYTIRECTTLLPARKSDKPSKSDRAPVQIISTAHHGTRNLHSLDSTYLRQRVVDLLQPEHVVNVTRCKDLGASSKLFLVNVWKRDHSEQTMYFDLADLMSPDAKPPPKLTP